MNRVALLSLSLCLAGTAAAQTILPGLNGGSGYAFDINDAGLVVGTGMRLDGYSVPVIWENGQVRELENFGYGKAVAINTIGDAVGAIAEDVLHAVPALWIGEIGTLLPHLGAGGEAMDINDDGVIVGFVFTPDGTGNLLPCKWVDGELQILNLAPQFGLGGAGVASRINNAGRIAGSIGFNAVAWDGDIVTVASNPLVNIGEVKHIDAAGSFAGNARGGDIRPIDWSPDGAGTILSLPTADAFGFVNGGAPNGLRVGAATESLNRYRASVWSQGTQFFLPEVMGAVYSEAFGANNNNQVAGIIGTGDLGLPVVWNFNPIAPIVQVPPMTGQVGQMMNFTATATLSGQPYANQSMLFRVAGVNLGTAPTDSTGTARLQARIPVTATSGNHELMASLGGSRYGIATIAIEKAASRLTNATVSGRRGATVTLASVLTNGPSGAALANQRVTFSGTSRPMTTMTAPNGRAQIGFRIPATAAVGSQIRVQVAFGGNAGHHRAAGTITVNVTQ